MQLARERFATWDPDSKSRSFHGEMLRPTLGVGPLPLDLGMCHRLGSRAGERRPAKGPDRRRHGVASASGGGENPHHGIWRGFAERRLSTRSKRLYLAPAGWDDQGGG